MRQVLIAYKYIPQYRAAFFDQLRDVLAAENLVFELVYGNPTRAEAKKKDAVRPQWAKHARSVTAKLSDTVNAIYQPIILYSHRFDLVIVEQANRLLANPVLLLLQGLGLRRVGYWGHGKNFQAEEILIGRTLKRIFARLPTWWFVYNEKSSSAVRDLGFSARQTSVVMNTIDTTSLSKHLNTVRDANVLSNYDADKLSLEHHCIYVGSMYDLKRLPFLLNACTKIRASLSSFRMTFVGSGVDAYLVQAFCDINSWCTYKEAQFGYDKALSFFRSSLMLMPGLVGLTIIDSFVACVPLVTTDVPFHSPEIGYLKPGWNGWIVSPPDDAQLYANTVVKILLDPQVLSRLRAGCLESASALDMSNMVKRFAQGACEALTL